MKKVGILVLMGMMSASAWAYLGEGNFNYQRRSFYSNGVGAYCERSQYHPEYRELGRREAREIDRTQFDGICADGYAQGPFNFRGRSYYANTEGHYCMHYDYHREFREFSEREARTVFNGYYDGICRE